MKKLLILALILLVAGSGSAFAAALAGDAKTSADGLTIYGGVDAADAAATTSVLLGKMSKGVYFRANTGTGGFACATYHGSGTKTYGTAYNSTAIYFKDVGTAAADSTWSLGNNANNSAFGAAWTAM